MSGMDLPKYKKQETYTLSSEGFPGSLACPYLNINIENLLIDIKQKHDDREPQFH